MLLHFEEEDVEALIETTFIMLSQYWSSLARETQEKSKTLLEYLLKDHQTVLATTIHRLPSLEHISELSDIWERFVSLRGPPLDTPAAFLVFSRRVLHANSGVVERGLVELSEYLRLHQDYLQTSAISEQPDSVVTELIRALLDCASKHSGINARISRLCAECIGFVGCLDSNRLETVRDQQDFVVLYNFDQAEETTDFVVFLLQEVLVKSFLSTTDIPLQGFLAYVLQELLDRCDFRDAISMQGGGGKAVEPIYRKWLLMSDTTREMLAPFLASSYRLAEMPPTTTEYPIIRAGRSYPNWLRQFTLDLLHRWQNVFAKIIFEPLRRAIRVKDLSIAVFLLPYLVLHVTLGKESTTEQRDAVWNELLLVLQHDVPENASYSEKEDKKLFCEVRCQILCVIGVVLCFADDRRLYFV